MERCALSTINNNHSLQCRYACFGDEKEEQGLQRRRRIKWEKIWRDYHGTKQILAEEIIFDASSACISSAASVAQGSSQV
mmetsp:Transcript_15214/g.43969  ORF Transcript_15214/g.43969 Transcript_15214/m.43969 type:complete len:80 (+) Transcript_15214:178-417(+)